MANRKEKKKKKKTKIKQKDKKKGSHLVFNVNLGLHVSLLTTLTFLYFNMYGLCPRVQAACRR